MNITIKSILIAMIPTAVLAFITWGSVTARQAETEKRVDRIEAESGRKFERIEAEWAHRFDRLETKLDRLIEQGRK